MLSNKQFDFPTQREGSTLAVLVDGDKNCKPADMSQASYLRYRKSLSLDSYIRKNNKNAMIDVLITNKLTN